MNSSVALSIIVPIYNVAEFLRTCLDSIIAQQLASYQVLLVDDGSTDTSGQIAEEYVAAYPTIFSYRKQTNQGVSSARNAGIKAASGDYLFFFDPDDYLAATGLAGMLAIAQQQELDMIAGNFCHDYGGEPYKPNRSFIEADLCTGLEWLEASLRKRKFIPAIWSKLHKRQFIVQHQLYFVEGLQHEDQLYAIECLLAATRLAAIDIPFYIYRHREGSLTSRRETVRALKAVESNMFTTRKLLDITDKNLSTKQRKLIMERCIKLLGRSVLELRQSISDESGTPESLIEQLNELRLYRFVRFSRFSHIIDWLTLRLGYDHYLNWRERKW